MEKSKKSINEEGGFLFWGGWNFSKLVSVGSTFIREMRVCLFGLFGHLQRRMNELPKKCEECSRLWDIRTARAEISWRPKGAQAQAEADPLEKSWLSTFLRHYVYMLTGHPSVVSSFCKSFGSKEVKSWYMFSLMASMMSALHNSGFQRPYFSGQEHPGKLCQDTGSGGQKPRQILFRNCQGGNNFQACQNPGRSYPGRLHLHRKLQGR